MSLIKQLRKSPDGRAQREIRVGHRVHTLTIRCMPFGYRLLRSVFNTWNDTFETEQAWNFQYLTNLFDTAKKEGFFKEIDPNADDWIGDTEPKPERVLSPEEEEEQERLEEDAWASEHPGEVRVRNDYWDYGSWYDIPKYINDYSDEYGRHYSYLGDDV